MQLCHICFFCKYENHGLCTYKKTRNDTKGSQESLHSIRLPDVPKTSYVSKQLGKIDGTKVSSLETSAWKRLSIMRSNAGVKCKTH